MFHRSRTLSAAFRKVRLVPICLLAALGTLGCGGGGGGGGSGNAATPIVYAGNSNAAVITAGNATRLAANVLGNRDAAKIVNSTQSAEGGAAQTQSSERGHLAQRLSQLFRETQSQRRQGSLSERVQPSVNPVDDTTACDSGSVHTSGSISNSGTGTLTVDFNDCRFGAETLNGPATLRVDAFDLANLIPTDLTISFTRLTLRGSGVNADMAGSLRSQLSIGTNTETTTENLVIVDNTTGGMTKTENLVFVSVAADILSLPSDNAQTITGRVFDSVHGYVDITTIDPLIFKSSSQLFPMPGRLLLAGSGNRRIRETATSGTQVMLELDLDGDASYELWTTVLWTAVTATTLTDFVRPTAPEVSVTVNSDRSVTINWTPSTDSNGIREYRIRRGTMPLGRTIGTSFTDRSVEPGSVADYYVRAVDNSGNLSDLLPPKSVKIPSGGTAAYGLPIFGTLPFASNNDGIGIGVADVNGDGNRDLVVSGGSSSQIATALGPLTGGISFAVSPVDFAPIRGGTNLPFFDGPLTIERGNSWKLRHRIVVHEGEADVPALDSHWQTYATPPELTLV